MARLGIGILIIPQKPWEIVAKELNDYRRVFREVNGTDAPPPIGAGWTFCDENADRAEELACKYIGGYWQSVVKHYELIGDHLTKMKGYESYAEMQEMATAPGGVDAMTEFFLNLQVWGTPEQCYEKILDIQKRTGAEAFTGVFSYAGMPYDIAEANMRLFATEVMPELQEARADRGPADRARGRRAVRGRLGVPSAGLRTGRGGTGEGRPAAERSAAPWRLRRERSWERHGAPSVRPNRGFERTRVTPFEVERGTGR